MSVASLTTPSPVKARDAVEAEQAVEAVADVAMARAVAAEAEETRLATAV